MLIDLHTHTRPLSWDSYLSPDDLIERSRQAGLDAICLSEHDYLWDPDDVAKLAKRHNYLVLPAIEINTDDGHILVYGITKYVYGMHRSHELAHHVEAANGAMVAAHPYRRQMPWYMENERDYQDALVRASQNPAYRYCAALEKINGRGTTKENKFSADLCDYMEVAGTAGTDSHSRSDIGRCATNFERDVNDVAGLIEELKAGRFDAVDLTGKPHRLDLTALSSGETA
ncbi:MAG: PHP-associated domain-containing protein [Dehalococcoidia bacterium]